MTVTNVSTYASLQSLLQNMSTVQNSLNNDQEQLSSGHKSQTFDGLSSSVEQLTSLNAQVARLANYQQDNTNLIGQLQATNTAMGQVVQIANSVKSLVATQLSGTTSVASFQQAIQSQMASLTSVLNTTYGSNYIFSGTNTTTSPIKSPIPVPAQIGVPDASYYQGNDQDPTARITDSQRITPNIRADATAFQQLFAGMQQALAANNSGSTTTTIAALTSAENLIDNGTQGAISLQANVNTNILNVQNADTQSQTVQTYFTGIINNLSATDVVSVSTQVAQDTSILQAAFAAYGRISQLTLTAYLR